MINKNNNPILLNGKKAQENVRLFIGIAIILFGTLGSLFLGLGIIYLKDVSIFIGEIIFIFVSLILTIIGRLLK